MADRLIIGLMSGTSVDAIDAALVRVGRGRGKYQAKVIEHVERAWPVELRKRLLAVMAPAQATTQEICELNVLVARAFAGAVEKVIAESGVKRGEIAAVASHGQTICHLPPAANKSGGKVEAGSTLQIGDVPTLAVLTGLKVVGNFRPADMAVGGQGAPLVPWTDVQLFTHPRRVRCVQNIGGIANVTYVPPGNGGRHVDKKSARQVMAFDTGPGNMLMDAVVRQITRGREQFDRDGRIARRGKLCQRLLGRLKGHSYFSRRPPKSTGREMFGEAYARLLVESYENRKVPREDLVHTLTRLTAWSIVEAYRRFLPAMPEDVILCGGGADNPVLVAMLREELAAAGAKTSVTRVDAHGIPNKAKEAASFALLGAATLDGVAANVPFATGARELVVLGQVADGRPT